ncbi:hypothetical protein CC78DRAFT_537458 [Lojkania enalia]|uniref:Uncharacterized protein n=1 Tax=Lojkania enalia TaxID=147567 RepID=A0A9P4MY50_9PLEO|nr:hypothetical protein CC78DRAFT_537458 [Didymosphaeria enalia]
MESPILSTSPLNATPNGLEINYTNLKYSSLVLFPVEFMESVRRILYLRLADALIGIAKEKVPFYTKKLFNVEVETKDRVRHLLYQGGGKIEPDPCIKLQACR